MTRIPWPCLSENPVATGEPAASEAGSRVVGRARAAADRRGRPTEPAAPVGRRTAARGLLNARFGERDAAVKASGPWRRLGESESFPPCKPLKTNETELESRQFSPVRRTLMQRRRPSRPAEPVATPRPSSASFAGSRGAAKFSYPQPLEKARNEEGIWQAVAPHAGLGPRSRESRVRLAVSIPQGRPRPVRTRNERVLGICAGGLSGYADPILRCALDMMEVLQGVTLLPTDAAAPSGAGRHPLPARPDRRHRDPSAWTPSRRLLAMPALANAHDHCRPLSPTSFGAAGKPLEIGCCASARHAGDRSLSRRPSPRSDGPLGAARDR